MHTVLKPAFVIQVWQQVLRVSQQNEDSNAEKTIATCSNNKYWQGIFLRTTFDCIWNTTPRVGQQRLEHKQLLQRTKQDNLFAKKECLILISLAHYSPVLIRKLIDSRQVF